MRIHVDCPDRFLRVLGIADETGSLESLFTTLHQLEDRAEETLIQPVLHLSEHEEGAAFAFVVEEGPSAGPSSQVWMQGAIRYMPAENRWGISK